MEKLRESPAKGNLYRKMVQSNSEGKNMSNADKAIKNKDKFQEYPVWRQRVGLIIPSTNTVCEVDFHRLAPEGVSIQKFISECMRNARKLHGK
jgi:hypothetical protein